ARNLEDAPAVIAAAAHQLGAETAAEIAAALAAEETTINDVIENYDLVGIEVDAETGKVVTALEELPGYAAGVDATVEVDADPTTERVGVNGFMVEVNGTSSRVTIAGSTTAAFGTLNDFLAAVGASAEDVTINGNPANGEQALKQFMRAILES